MRSRGRNPFLPISHNSEIMNSFCPLKSFMAQIFRGIPHIFKLHWDSIFWDAKHLLDLFALTSHWENWGRPGLDSGLHSLSNLAESSFVSVFWLRPGVVCDWRLRSSIDGRLVPNPSSGSSPGFSPLIHGDLRELDCRWWNTWHLRINKLVI